jgi:hypothetical protein
MDLRHEVDPLAVAVVLGDRIGAAIVDATRDLPVRELVGANHSAKSRATSAWPSRSNAAPLSAPSRIQVRA